MGQGQPLVEINTMPDYGLTDLHRAVKADDSETVQALLQADASKNSLRYGCSRTCNYR